MKAILEIELSESCSTCRLMREERNPEGNFICIATGMVYYALYMLDRAPECPLEIIGDKECANCRNSEFVAATGQLYCLVHKQAVNENVCDKWGVKI